MQNRQHLDDYFLSLLPHIATRSTCLRRQIGALLVRDKQIITSGYNGPPTNIDRCIVCIREQENIPSGERQERCYAVHSEVNAILQAARHGISTLGTTLYVSTFPCSICARILINAGIVRIVYTDEYTDPFAKELLERAEIKMERRTNEN